MGNNQNIKTSLLPLSWLYGLVVGIRNKLFDKNILKHKSYSRLPIICVGNLSVGGTGKTPHVEYLIQLLRPKYKVAVLSRGYKRKTTEFTLATQDCNYTEIGDEPSQIKRKFPDIVVSVDVNRQHGIEKLLQLPEAERPEVIIMDDGFQHRWVKPSLSIILSDYNRPIYNDKLLPAGRLRESIHGLDRANIVLVTKCPKSLKPIDTRIESNNFRLFPYQELMFTTMTYGKLFPLDKTNNSQLELPELVDKEILLVTGIANPEPLVKKLHLYSSHITHLPYPDHYDFTIYDIESIADQFNEMNEEKRIVVVTEKDAVRLRSMKLPEELKSVTYYIPIEVAFLDEEEQQKFNKIILKHVRKNTRNCEFHQRKSF